MERAKKQFLALVTHLNAVHPHGLKTRQYLTYQCGDYPRVVNTQFVQILCPYEKMFIVSSLRKKYTSEYRQEAARLVIESGRPIAHVAKEIDIAEGL